MQDFLNANPEKLSETYAQPAYNQIGMDRKVKHFSNEELIKMIIQIKDVTGRWVMPNDVVDESSYRAKGGIARLTFAELVELNHKIFVTVRKSPRGTFGPADVSSTSHWISNTSTRTRPIGKT